MSDLIYLLDQLVDLKGNIIIPEVNRDVAPLTDDERASYTDIDFDKVSNEFRICGIVLIFAHKLPINHFMSYLFVNLSVYHSAQLEQKIFFEVFGLWLASHAGVFRGARISSLP